MEDLQNNDKYCDEIEKEEKYKVVNQDGWSQSEMQPIWVNTEQKCFT